MQVTLGPVEESGPVGFRLVGDVVGNGFPVFRSRREVGRLELFPFGVGSKAIGGLGSSGSGQADLIAEADRGHLVRPVGKLGFAMLFQFWGGHASNVGITVNPRAASRGVVCPGDAEKLLKALDGLVVGGIEPRAEGEGIGDALGGELAVLG